MKDELVEELRQLSEDSSEAADRARCRAFIEAADRIESLEAKLEKAREALDFYARWHEQPSEGPWGANSTDFGDTARKALREISQ